MTQTPDDDRVLDLEPLVDDDTGRALSDDEILTDGTAANQSVPGLPDADETDQTGSDAAAGNASDPAEPGWTPDDRGETHTHS